MHLVSQHQSSKDKSVTKNWTHLLTLLSFKFETLSLTIHPSQDRSASKVYPSNHGEVRGFKPGLIFL